MQPALCGGMDDGYEEDSSHYDQGGIPFRSENFVFACGGAGRSVRAIYFKFEVRYDLWCYLELKTSTQFP